MKNKQRSLEQKDMISDVNISEYPSISYEKAQEKVERSITNINKGKGISSNEFFRKMLVKIND